MFPKSHETPRRGRGALVLGAFVVAALLPACSGGQKGDSRNSGPFELTLVSTGLGQVFPYRIAELDAFGQPSTTIVNVTSKSVLEKNLSTINGVLPVASWPTTAKLPNGAAGNQFLMFRFSHELQASSILSNLAANQTNSGLTGAIQILAYDPVTETQTTVVGRGFVGGYTYYDDPNTPVLDLTLTKAVTADKDGNVSILDNRANGFPMGFQGDEDLVASNTFVFIPDVDKNLNTFETYPAGTPKKVIRLIVSTSVLDYRNKPLVQEMCGATVVGQDTGAPEVLGYTKATTGGISILPGNGAQNVEPTTTIRVTFTKPVQPRDVGVFFSKKDKTPATRGISLSATFASAIVPVIYYADPASTSDLCNYIVTPAYQFPGQVSVTIGVNTTIHSLAGKAVANNVSTNFKTGVGPGIVNAPVAPEVIYVGRTGSHAGVSVIDLNGFGQGTGDLNDTAWVKNPNIAKPGVWPVLQLGSSNFDAGGAGVLTLARDTNLSDRLLDETLVAQVADIHIGHPLDKIFNNAGINANATESNQVNPSTGASLNAWGNSISIAPHPNPPRLVFPPPNPGMSIWGEEPSVKSSGPAFVPGEIMTTHPPAGPCRQTPLNLLVKGNPLANKGAVDLGIYGGISNSVFHGPQPPPPTPQPPTPFCQYTSRQQVGHFLYVLDRGKKRVLVLNSNRFTVLETIPLTDPYSMAISPNLKLLTVTNFGSNRVSVIDIDPASPTFHQITKEVKVGRGPAGIAWEPEGEDCIVVNQIDNSLSLIRGSDLEVRKTVSGFINQPLEIAVSPRQNGIGFNTGIYFAYVLNKNGTIAVFESGPDGVNGIGFDDVVGIPRNASFKNATTLQVDINALSSGSALWICHTSAEGDGQVSHLELTSSPTGPLPINSNQGGGLLPPTFRERVWSVTSRIGGRSASTPVKDLLSGNTPIDLAYDDIYNFGAAADSQSTQFSNLVYAEHSGKGMIKGGAAASRPRLLFIALGDTGHVDVVELDTGKVITTIDIPGVSSLANYWRQ